MQTVENRVEQRAEQRVEQRAEQRVEQRAEQRAEQRVEQRVAGAGSAALRALLDGPPAGGVVVHAGREAVYADLGGRLVGILARGAVHVPCGIATALAALPDLAVGEPVGSGAGQLRAGPLQVRLSRLVSFAVPHLAAHVARSLASASVDLSAARDQLPLRALALLAAGDPAAVPMLLGRGDGLTPVGDDVLAGWLVATRAAGRPNDAVAGAVHAALDRTTSLSAALLRHAAAGEAIPAFRSVLASGGTEAVAGLLAVGHSSGAGMLLGARLALFDPPVDEALEGSTR